MKFAIRFSVVSDEFRGTTSRSKYEPFIEALAAGKTVFSPREQDVAVSQRRLGALRSAAAYRGSRMRTASILYQGEAGHVMWWERAGGSSADSE